MKTQDEIFVYPNPGPGADHACCRIRVFRTPQRGVHVLLTDLGSRNPGASLSNSIETIHMALQGQDEFPFTRVVIQHFVGDHLPGGVDCSVVSFDHAGNPSWKAIAPDAVASLLECDVAELLTAELPEGLTEAADRVRLMPQSLARRRVQRERVRSAQRSPSERRSEIPDHVSLDGWAVAPKVFSSAPAFQSYLNREARLADIDDALSDPQEVLVPTDWAVVVLEGNIGESGPRMCLRLPVCRVYPFWEDLPRHAGRRPGSGITRGILQLQIQNGLAGFPLDDHRFVEGLSLREIVDGVPVYDLSMGS